MTEWAGVLDTFEHQLIRQDAAYRRGGKMPRGLRLEPPSEPMTDGERLRALDLMQRTDALITETLATLRSNPKPRHSPYS